jgi:hypothetical protein
VQSAQKEARFQVEAPEERIASNGAAITTVVTSPAGHLPPGQQP